MWFVLAKLSWGISAALVAWMIYDWIKIDTTHLEEDLISSPEGHIASHGKD